MNKQIQRYWYQTAFFSLFVLAPPLDLFRFDLNLNHLLEWVENERAIAVATGWPIQGSSCQCPDSAAPVSVKTGTR